MGSDLEKYLMKRNKSAVENAMKLAENDDENVVLKNINNLNLIG
jgi:hypothetical protein